MSKYDPLWKWISENLKETDPKIKEEKYNIENKNPTIQNPKNEDICKVI